jgi:hypothetical protein
LLAPIEIGQVCQLTKTFTTGTPLSVTQDLAIEGIDHEINVSSGHRITLYTSQTTVLNAFILNDITYGTLDTNNALS